MTYFKKGDLVRRIGWDNGDIKTGDIVEIEEDTTNFNDIKIVGKKPSNGMSFAVDKFELVWEKINESYYSIF